MKDTGHVTEKLTLIFFYFIGVFHCFSINIRIKEHFFRLHWEMKGHLSCVNLVKRFCSFALGNETKKSALQSLSATVNILTTVVIVHKYYLYITTNLFHQSWAGTIFLKSWIQNTGSWNLYHISQPSWDAKRKWTSLYKIFKEMDNMVSYWYLFYKISVC